MARVFVYSENLTARAEIVADDETGHLSAFCIGCSGGRRIKDHDLLEGTHVIISLADAAGEAGNHVDRCRKCAEQLCRTPGVHDAGYRCRKDY